MREISIVHQHLQTLYFSLLRRNKEALYKEWYYLIVLFKAENEWYSFHYLRKHSLLIEKNML